MQGPKCLGRTGKSIGAILQKLQRIFYLLQPRCFVSDSLGTLQSFQYLTHICDISIYMCKFRYLCRCCRHCRLFQIFDSATRTVPVAPISCSSLCTRLEVAPATPQVQVEVGDLEHWDRFHSQSSARSTSKDKDKQLEVRAKEKESFGENCYMSTCATKISV